MNAFRFRHALSLACTAILSGCNSIVLEHAKIDADLPLAPAAVMPDSSKFGDIAIQGAVRVSDGTAWSDSVYNWTTGRIGGYGQVQVALNHNFRIVAGGGWSASPSYWMGASSTSRLGSLNFDADLLFGYTRQTHYLTGHEYDYGYDYDYPKTPNPDSLRVFASGTRWTGWMNLALRVRSIGDGPWAEMRFLPGFEWGTLRRLSSSYDDRKVNTGAYSISVGWLQNFENGSILMVGPRATEIDRQNVPDLQLTASLQAPLRL